MHTKTITKPSLIGNCYIALHTILSNNTQLVKNSIHSLALVLLLLLLSSCGQAIGTIPVDVQPYVDRFIAEAHDRGKEVSNPALIVRFEKPSQEGRWGECVGEQVNLDPATWATLCDLEKEELVFHELGHCLLHKMHEAGTLADGSPAHIMSIDLPYLQDYQASRATMLAYLFQ